jgi:hypothetical protein
MINLRTLENNFKNSCGTILSNRSRFPFFENGDNWCLLPQFRKSIPRYDKIKTKPENMYTDFRRCLHNKTRYTVGSDWFRWSQPFYSILNIGIWNGN